MHRRQLLQLTLTTAAAALAPQRALAQLVEQPIRIVFPYAGGGSGDTLARLVADKMRVTLSRPVIVEDRAGGAGRIGVMQVKNAAPTGDTLLLTPIATMAVYQYVYKSLGYDPFTDFTPVSQLATFDFALAVGPQVPAQSLRQLVAWVKADPDMRGVYGGPGTGDLPHFLGVLFARAAGLKLRHVAYRGSAAAIVDLAGGQIPMLIVPLSDVIAMHKEKRVRILASSGHTDSPFAPDVPTFREEGYDIEGSSWYAAFAPAKTPAATIAKLSAAMAAAVRQPDVVERLHAFGLVPTGTTAAELGAIQRADAARWATAVRLSGFQAEEPR